MTSTQKFLPPSGERPRVTPWVSPATASQPLAGRSPIPYPARIEPMFPPLEERPGVSGALLGCVICALSGALSASVIAILIFVFTR